MQTESDVELPEWARDLVSALDEKMGLRLRELSTKRVAGSMPVAGNTQPFLMWHGGASGVLIESLASMGAAAIGYPDRFGVGVDLSVTHLRPVTSGWVHGVAVPLRVGKSSVVFQVDLTDDEEELIAVGRLTCRLVNSS